MKTGLLVVGLLLPVIASIAYIISIIKGRTRPQRMTRFLLLIITSLTFASLWASGDTSGIWLALVSVVQAVSIWVLSLKRGMGGKDKTDYICLALCAVGLLAWLVAGQPWVGLAASIIADFIAVIPALRKTVRFPHTELMVFYALDTIAGFCILAAGLLTWEAMVFPLYIALINAAFVVAIAWPRQKLARVGGLQ